MKIGITGQNGFIGGSVSRALAEAGYDVVPLDAFTRSFQNEEKDFQDCPKDLAWVLHFGAKTSIPDSIESPFETYWNNVGSTITALKIADRCRSAFLFMSSYVYGQPQYVPIDEMHPVKPMNPYMGSKIIGEDICRQLCSMVNMPLVILRGFNIFGDHHISGRLIPDLLEAIRKKVPMVLNDPRPVRDYLYIKDFVSLAMKILTRHPIETGTYNVGCGRSYSNLEVAELVYQISNGNCPLNVLSNPRAGDVLDCSVDTSLVKRTFSWKPEYSLERALRELIGNIEDA